MMTMYGCNTGRVIKAQDVSQAETTGKSLSSFIQGIRAGTRKARELAEEEERERLRAEQKAYERGFEEGLQEGITREKTGLSPTVTSLAQLLTEVGSLKGEILEHARKEIVDLAFAIAGKVIHREVDTSKDVVLSVLGDALNKVEGGDDITIRAHPEDCHHIREAAPGFMNSYGDIAIEEDEAIGRGGAVIETRWGSVDARLDQQLNNIRESFHNEHGL